MTTPSGTTRASSLGDSVAAGAPPGMRAFRTLWCGALLSSLGSATSAFALGLWLFSNSGATFSYSIIFFFRLAPRILLSPFAGVLADFLPRRQTLMACGALGAASSLALLTVVLRAELTVSAAYTYLLVSACIDAVRGVVYSAALSDLVDPNDYARASGFNAFYRLADSFVAPAVAIFLLHAVGLAGVLVADVATFAVSIAAVAITPFALTFKHEALTLRSAARGLLHGFRAIAARPAFLYLATAFALVNVCTASVQGVLVPLMGALDAPSHVATVNLLAGAATFGGATYIARFGVQQASSAKILMTFAAVAAVFGVSAIWTTLPGIYLLCAIIGLVMPWMAANNDVLWRTAYPSAEIGRVIAARTVISQLPLPFVYLGVGPLVDHVLAHVVPTWSNSTYPLTARFSTLFAVEAAMLATCVVLPMALRLRRGLSPPLRP